MAQEANSSSSEPPWAVKRLSHGTFLFGAILAATIPALLNLLATWLTRFPNPKLPVVFVFLGFVSVGMLGMLVHELGRGRSKVFRIGVVASHLILSLALWQMTIVWYLTCDRWISIPFFWK